MTKPGSQGLHHDTNRKRAVVYVRWEADPEKNLGLVIPFGLSLDNVRDEATKAERLSPKNWHPHALQSHNRSMEAARFERNA
jgi:hypothetical protein